MSVGKTIKGIFHKESPKYTKPEIDLTDPRTFRGRKTSEIVVKYEGQIKDVQDNRDIVYHKISQERRRALRARQSANKYALDLQKLQHIIQRDIDAGKYEAKIKNNFLQMINAKNKQIQKIKEEGVAEIKVQNYEPLIRDLNEAEVELEDEKEEVRYNRKLAGATIKPVIETLSKTKMVLNKGGKDLLEMNRYARKQIEDLEALMELTTMEITDGADLDTVIQDFSTKIKDVNDPYITKAYENLTKGGYITEQPMGVEPSILDDHNTTKGSIAESKDKDSTSEIDSEPRWKQEMEKRKGK